MSATIPKVSIVVAIYNVEKYVDACIQSIVNQTYTNLEIILVDDGSTDDSPIICDKYANSDSRILVIHKENGGLSDARNIGLNYTTGDYVAFVDGDDLVAINYIEQLALPIINGLADFVICDSIEIVDIKSFSQTIPPQKEADVISSKQALIECLKGERIGVTAWGKLGNRKLWCEHPFPKGKVYEDLYTVPTLFNDIQTVAHIPVPLYGQVMRSGSITRSDTISEKQYRDYYDAIAHIQEIFIHETSPLIVNAYKMRETTEYSRIIRLYRLIDNPTHISSNIYSKAREAILANINADSFTNYPAKTKILAILGAYLPRLQMLIFNLYQLKKRIMR